VDENNEIKKDNEALKKYLESGQSKSDSLDAFIKSFCEKANLSYPFVNKCIDDESKFKVNYYDTIKNNFGLRTPARVGNGIIEVPKSMFDKKGIEYHRMKIKTFSIITVLEVGQIEGNIHHNIEVTNKRIREWFDYADTEIKEYKESKKFLKELNLGEEVKTDWLAVGIVYRFKKNLIKKFWWRMGLLGIKERIKVFKRERLAKQLKHKNKDNERIKTILN